jgi:hypothetical protein
MHNDDNVNELDQSEEGTTLRRHLAARHSVSF